MGNLFKKGVIIILALAILVGNTSLSFATGPNELEAAIIDTAEYMYKTVSSPEVGSIGGEWAILGLARSDYDVPEQYYQKYHERVEDYAAERKGILHTKKYTEYSRLIMALTAIGKDPTDVGGYNLLTPLGDYEKTIWQGINGPVWALIALDSGNYPMPRNLTAKVQATREMYIQRILDCQLADGGWSLFGGTEAETAGYGVSDPDITGMVLQALAKYQDRTDVKKACDEALLCMSNMQNDEAGFSSWGIENLESGVQMLVALGELGIPLDDSRFVKNGKNILDSVMTFYKKGKGFLHTKNNEGVNQMASEQGFYGLVAAYRAMNGKNSLYRMGDVANTEKTEGNMAGPGLANKHPQVYIPQISKPEKTFEDIKGHDHQAAIEALAEREIINGKTETTFEPNATMSKGEFVAIVVKALGLNNKVTDVKGDEEVASHIEAANAYGMITAKSEKDLDTAAVVTREEAATILANAAKICGMDTDYDNMRTRDILAQFTDYVKSSSWARSSLAFCYDKGIMDESVIKIEPKEGLKRSEAAQMLLNMLSSAKLL